MAWIESISRYQSSENLSYVVFEVLVLHASRKFWKEDKRGFVLDISASKQNTRVRMYTHLVHWLK